MSWTNRKPQGLILIEKELCGNEMKEIVKDHKQ